MLKFIIWQILSKQERYDKVYMEMAKVISHLSYVKLNKLGCILLVKQILKYYDKQF